MESNDYYIDENRDDIRLQRKLAQVMCDYLMAVEENILLRAELEQIKRVLDDQSKKRSYAPGIN